MESLILVQLFNNAMLLTGLGALFSLLAYRCSDRSIRCALLKGLLFGAVTIVGMQAPLTLAEGVFYDARSVVLACAGLYVSAPGALFAALLASLARWAHGGTGTVVGILVILTTVGLGALLRIWLQRDDRWRARWTELLVLAIAAQIAQALLQLMLPPAAQARFFNEAILPVVLIFTPATVALGLLLQTLTRQRYMNALVHATFRGLPDPVAFRTNSQWLLGPAFLSRFKHTGRCLR
jgi:hypothetical protein